MESDKPFKTIEVVDNDTKQTCKVACMSCIRGHRTTSCGIPICRSKIFWTVKRPGRPSNSCNCRFNSSGMCKCVTALPKCPHKLKKGEKRRNECRCDEQGRFCCLLDPQHWDSLMRLQKPLVQFFPNREALEGLQMTQSPPSTDPSTPGLTFHSMTPQRNASCCGTVTTQNTPRISRSIAPSPATSMVSNVVVPQFAFVDVGAPWSDQTLQRDFQHIPSPQPDDMNQSSCCQPNDQSLDETYDQPSSCCQPSNDSIDHGYAQQCPCCQSTTQTLGSQCPCCQPSSQTQDYTFDQQSSCCQDSVEPTSFTFEEPFQTPYQPQDLKEPYSNYPAPSSAAALQPPPSSIPTFDLDTWNQEYQRNRFPNAICQNCGLSGCTCRSCPAVMQNFGTTSWAQSCGRKHATFGPTPGLDSQQQQQQQQPHHLEMMPQTSCCGGHVQPVDAQSLPLHTLPSLTTGYDNILPLEVSDPLVYSDFLMDELDRPSHIPNEHMFGG